LEKEAEIGDRLTYLGLEWVRTVRKWRLDLKKSDGSEFQKRVVERRREVRTANPECVSEREKREGLGFACEKRNSVVREEASWERERERIRDALLADYCFVKELVTDLNLPVIQIVLH
jgi:hypothetical protein